MPVQNYLKLRATEPVTLFSCIQVVVKGLVCAGKKIHEVLLDAGNVEVRDIAQKYLQECQLMSDLRHPNITQEQGDVGVTKIRHQLAFLQVLLSNVSNVNIACIKKNLVDLLSSTNKAFDYNLDTRKECDRLSSSQF